MGRDERKLAKLLSRHEVHKERAQRAKRFIEQQDRPRVRVRTDAEDWDIYEEQPARSAKTPVHAPVNDPSAVEGWIVSAGMGVCTVRNSSGDSEVRSMPGVAPGDRVIADSFAVRRILPRRSVLSRAVPGQPLAEQVLAANIDVVVHVVSLVAPPLRPGLIDRYLIAIERGGARPLICVNKIDLASADDRQPLELYKALDIPMVFCSAHSAEGLEELAAHLCGRLSVFTGHSGVGKSSLLNALIPELRLRTGEVGKKGRHTTSNSSVHALPAGGYVIDTPGIREWGLWAIERHELREYFPEFGEYRCRFGDCMHSQEPECGVRDAVESGRLSARRYAAYLRIVNGD